MKYINIIKALIPYVLGTLFIVISIGMFLVPMFYEVKEKLPWWIPAFIGFIGMGLMFIPKDVIGFLKKLLTRKADTL